MINCSKCGACCKGKFGVYIFPVDVIPICSYISISPQQFLEIYCDKRSLLLDGKKISIYALKQGKNQCIFLSNLSLCTIYQVRPTQCKFAPQYFLRDESLWSHMGCLDINPIEKDIHITDVEKIVVSDLLKIGYKHFFGR